MGNRQSHDSTNKMQQSAIPFIVAYTPIHRCFPTGDDNAILRMDEIEIAYT